MDWKGYMEQVYRFRENTKCQIVYLFIKSIYIDFLDIQKILQNKQMNNGDVVDLVQFSYACNDFQDSQKGIYRVGDCRQEPFTRPII